MRSATLTLFFFALIFSFPLLAQEQPQEKSLGPWTYQAGSSLPSRFLPDISVTGDFAGAFFSTDPVGDTGHDPARTGINLQEIELALQSAVDPYFRADVFLGFREDGVELEEGFATTTFIKRLTLKVGKFLMPFGRQNTKHLHSWAFADSMLVNKSFLGVEGFNELAVQADYLLPLPFFVQITGAFANGDNAASFNGARKGDFVYSGRLATSIDLSPSLTLLLGASGAFGANDSSPGNLTQLYGGDLLLRYKSSPRFSLSWQSEYMLRRRQEPAMILSDGGFYSYLDVQFARRWRAGLRLDAVGWPAGTLTQQWRLTPALSFQPTEFSRLRLQYEYDKTDAVAAVHEVILQLQFSFGVHAAHAY